MAEKRITAGPALQAFCLDCLGGQRYDCLCGPRAHLAPYEGCPLYLSMPWRGRAMPPSTGPKTGIPDWESRNQQELNLLPKRRVTGRLLTAYCRHECQPEDKDDCGGRLNPGTPSERACALYPWHPYKVGGPRKTPRTPQQQEASRRAGLRGFAKTRQGNGQTALISHA